MLDKEDLLSSSFAPLDEGAPNQSTQDDPSNNTQQQQQQPPQPDRDVKATTSAQDIFEADRPIPATPPITRSKRCNSPKVTPKRKVSKISVRTLDTPKPSKLANTFINNTPVCRSSRLPKPNPKYSA